MTCGPHNSGGHDSRRGFTLLESLMAVGLLLTVVSAVSLTVSAGQRHAYEAHSRIAATLAAEELMAQLINEAYDDLPTWNGYTEAVGAMLDVNGNPMPESFHMVGRDVAVTTSIIELSELNIKVRGRTIRIQAFNVENETLADLSRFIPEPQEYTYSEVAEGPVRK